MKRCFKIIITLSIFILVLVNTFDVYAQQDEEYIEQLNSYDLSSFDKLDKNTKEYLEDLDIDNFDYESLASLNIEKIIGILKDVFINSVSKPLKSFSIIVIYIILSAYMRAVNNEIKSNDISSFYSTISSLIICIFLASCITDCIKNACDAVKIVADFSYAFFPAFCIIVAASGGVLTSFSVNTLLLTLAQGINYISQMIIIPATNCFLAIAISSSIRFDLNLNSLVSTMKKIILSVISSVSAIFISILSIKTSVSSKADALGLRSMRFAINSVVPVIGPSISEGLISIQSYSGLVKTSVGIVGIIAVFSVFFPAMCSTAIWRFVLLISSMCAEVFDDLNTSNTILAFKDTLLIVQVILILTMLTTVISIGILVAAGTVK